MSFKEDARHFLILYNNGDTFFFTLYKNGDIYCEELSKLYKKITGQDIAAANTVEFSSNNFKLKNSAGEIIYSLEQYNKTIGESIEEDLAIERFYIDTDVRNEILEKEKITFAPTVKQIPGLIDETETKGYARTRKLSIN